MDKINKIFSYSSLIILCLYMAVVFVPEMDTYEIMTPQWLYLSVVNLGVFCYFLYSKSAFKINIKDKLTSFFFLCHLGFLLICVLSMVKSRSTDESLLYISWYATFFGAILNFYFLFHQPKKISFVTVAKLISLVLLIESFNVVSYFLSNFNQPRSGELVNGVSHFYGNRNILAIALAIKIPFVMYLLKTNKGIIKILAVFTVFFATAGVLLIGARTAILAMFLVYIATIITSIILFRKEKEKPFVFPGTLIVIFCFSLLIALSTNKIYSGFNSFKDLVVLKSKQNLYLDLPLEKSMSNNSGRFLFWGEAIRDIKENPLLGVGAGNWKFDNYDKVLIEVPNTSYMTLGQPHNDFLQHFAEVGIFGFLFYLGVFVLALIMLIKKLKAATKPEDKFIITTLAFGIMAYVIDAMLNFPHERPTIQLFFALFLVLVFSVGKVIKSEEANDSENKSFLPEKPLGVAIITLSVFTLVINYCMFNSALIQYEIAKDAKNINAFTDPYSMSYETFIRRMPNFPDAMILGESIEHSKALYALSDNKDKEALKHLDKAIKQFPNNYVSEGLKAQYFYVNDDLDSSYYYARHIFDKSPSVKGNFTILTNIYVKRKDTTNLFKVIDQFSQIKPNVPFIWNKKASAVLKYRKDPAQAIKVLDSGLYYNPKNKALIEAKDKLKGAIEVVKVDRPTISKEEFKVKENQLKSYYDKGNNFFTAKKYNQARTEYLKALEVSPGNLPILYKLGFLEKNVKNYTKSLEYFTSVIDANFVNDGRPEYNRGVVYLRLKDQANAKRDFTISREKGFPLALKLDASKFD